MLYWGYSANGCAKGGAHLAGKGRKNYEKKKLFQENQ